MIEIRSHNFVFEFVEKQNRSNWMVNWVLQIRSIQWILLGVKKISSNWRNKKSTRSIVRWCFRRSKCVLVHLLCLPLIGFVCSFIQSVSSDRRTDGRTVTSTLVTTAAAWRQSFSKCVRQLHVLHSKLSNWWAKATHIPQHKLSIRTYAFTHVHTRARSNIGTLHHLTTFEYILLDVMMAAMMQMHKVFSVHTYSLTHSYAPNPKSINFLWMECVKCCFNRFQLGALHRKRDRQKERESEGKKRVGMAFQMKIKMKLKCTIVCQSYLSGHS